MNNTRMALGATAEPAQPTPHSAVRSAHQAGDPAVPQTGCLRQQRPADHDDLVCPAKEHRRR
ncbi:MAG: hypothetical protein ACRDTH_17425 [Pseudonocardiaceae bacterium]